MATYESSALTVIGGVTGGSTAGSVLAAYRAPTTQRAEIKEIGIFQVTAGTSPNGIGIVRSSALGTGAATIASANPRDLGAAASGAGGTAGGVVTAWATAAPTTGGISTALRRWTTGTTVGSGVIWTFDLQRMLMVPLGTGATGELVFVNLYATAPATYQLYVCWEE